MDAGRELAHRAGAGGRVARTSDVAGSDTETRLPIGVVAPPIVGIEARRIEANISKLPELWKANGQPS